MRRYIFLIWVYGFLIIGLSGCATTTYYIPPPVIKEGMPGIYHRVEKGQTMWRIAKAYNIDLEELVEINHILEVRRIQPGQLIFIPQSETRVTPAPLNQLSLVSEEGFIWPLKGKIISRFRQETNNIINQGIDIQAPYGSSVVASRSGVVTFYNQQLKGLGKTIIVDHGDNFLTVYARNSDVFVKEGDRVTQGKVIAKVGSAGRDRTSYLHFEIRKGHIPQNPYYFLP